MAIKEWTVDLAEKSHNLYKSEATVLQCMKSIKHLTAPEPLGEICSFFVSELSAAISPDYICDFFDIAMVVYENTREGPLSNNYSFNDCGKA
jgi:hypothetical protein